MRTPKGCEGMHIHSHAHAYVHMHNMYMCMCMCMHMCMYMCMRCPHFSLRQKMYKTRNFIVILYFFKAVKPYLVGEASLVDAGEHGLHLFNGADVVAVLLPVQACDMQ